MWTRECYWLSESAAVLPNRSIQKHPPAINTVRLKSKPPPTKNNLMFILSLAVPVTYEKNEIWSYSKNLNE